MHPPRQIYASTADRRHGRRWSRRHHRPLWALLAIAAPLGFIASEFLRSVG